MSPHTRSAAQASRRMQGFPDDPEPNAAIGDSGLSKSDKRDSDDHLDSPRLTKREISDCVKDIDPAVILEKAPTNTRIKKVTLWAKTFRNLPPDLQHECRDYFRAIAELLRQESHSGEALCEDSVKRFDELYGQLYLKLVRLAASGDPKYMIEGGNARPLGKDTKRQQSSTSGRGRFATVSRELLKLVCCLLVSAFLYGIHRGWLFPPPDPTFVDHDKDNWGREFPKEITLGFDREMDSKVLTLYPVSNVPAVQQIWVHPMSIWSRMGSRLNDSEQLFAQGNLLEELKLLSLDIAVTKYNNTTEKYKAEIRETFDRLTRPIGIVPAVRHLHNLQKSCTMRTFSDGPCNHCNILAKSISRLESISAWSGESKLQAEFWGHIKIMKNPLKDTGDALRCSTSHKDTLMDLDTNLKRLHALIFNEAKIGAQWKTFQARFLELLRTNKEVDFSKLEYRRKLLSEGLQDRQILAMRFIEDAERIALDTRKVLEDANKRRKDRSFYVPAAQVGQPFKFNELQSLLIKELRQVQEWANCEEVLQSEACVEAYPIRISKKGS